MERKSTKVYLSLGGNIGNAFLCLKQALALLSFEQHAIASLKISHFYQTSPLQVESLNWFVNAACSFSTNLSIQEIFKLTQNIEKQLGKIEKPKNADRPIDIDILFYGNHFYRNHELDIPHPRWKERLFVLIPLLDLTGEIFLQGERDVEHYLLPDLIQSLLLESNQTVSLLEKNPYNQ